MYTGLPPYTSDVMEYFLPKMSEFGKSPYFGLLSSPLTTICWQRWTPQFPLISSREDSESHTEQFDEDVEPIESDEVATGQRVQLASSRKNPDSQMHSVAPTIFVIEPLQSALLQFAQAFPSLMNEPTGQVSKQELPSREENKSASHSEQDV